MNKSPIAHLSLQELLALREMLWRKPPTPRNLQELGRVDRRIAELQREP